MENPRADAHVVFTHQLAGLGVERDEARGSRRRDVDVGPVLAVGGADVEDAVDHEHRAVGGVVREDAQLIHHVVAPKDVGILLGGIDRCGLLRRVLGHVLGLVGVGALVAIGHAFSVEAQHFAAAGDDPQAVAHHQRRGQKAQVLPVVDLARLELGHHELPEVSASLFVEAVQDRAVARVLLVAGRLVVGAHVHLAAGNHRVAVALRAELHGPLHALGGGQVDLLGTALQLTRLEAIGQALGRREEVAARIVAAPLGPIFGARQKAGAQQCGGEKRKCVHG